MDNQLTKLDFLDKQAAIFKNSKQNLENNTKQIHDIVTQNTKKEVEDVQKALDILNKKLELIMKSDVIKEKKASIEEDHKKMKLSIEVAANTFFKIRKMLYEKNLTREQRLDYEKKVYNKIISKFLTQKEIDEFEQLIRMAPVMMLGNSNNKSILY